MKSVLIYPIMSPEEDKPEEQVIEAEVATLSINANLSTINETVVPVPEKDLKDTYQELSTAIEGAESYTEFLDEHQDSVVVFFAIANEVLKDKGGKILEAEILKAEHQEGVIASEFGRKKIYDLLSWADIIDTETQKMAKRSFDYRDTLVHEPEARHRQRDLDQLDERMQDALELVQTLTDIDWEDW